MTKLYTIAHSRAGDKGNTSTLSLIPFKEEDYHLLCEKVTAKKVREHLWSFIQGDVKRYELDNIKSLLFVCEETLCGGVTTSLSLDSHGKCLSSLLLEMDF
jgi:hypothetical protein